MEKLTQDEDLEIRLELHQSPKTQWIWHFYFEGESENPPEMTNRGITILTAKATEKPGLKDDCLLLLPCIF